MSDDDDVTDGPEDVIDGSADALEKLVMGEDPADPNESAEDGNEAGKEPTAEDQSPKATMDLEDLGKVEPEPIPEPPETVDEDSDDQHSAEDLEPVFDVPVSVQAVLGKTHVEVSDLLKLGPGTVVELDRKVGEAIDIYVNDRLVARGEVVLVEDHLGVTMTEIIKSDAT